jgi:enoyl-CoA hydratase
MTADDDIQFELRGHVAVLTLDAPRRRNALTPAMARRFAAVLAEVEATPEVGVLVLRGAGGYFCAGGDRATLARAGADPAADDTFKDMDAIYQTFPLLGGLGVPTIAAVRGGAVGAGVNLALAADVRIIARDAVLRSGFLEIGVHPGGGHFQLLERHAGHEATAAMTLLGEPVDGTRAQQLGLALEVVDDGQVEARALELAARVTDPELTRLATRSLREQRGVPWAVALRAEQSAQMWSLRRRAG